MSVANILESIEPKIINRINIYYCRFMSFIGFPGKKFEIERINRIKNQSKKKNYLKNLINSKSCRPEWYRELSNISFTTTAPDTWEILEKYNNLRNSWLESKNLDKIGIEFIPISMVVGSLGQHKKLEMLIKSNMLGLRKEKKQIIVFPENYKLTNTTLYSYFQRYFVEIIDTELYNSLKIFQSYLELPLEVSLPLNIGFPHEEIAGNIIEQKWDYENRPPLFKIKEDHFKKGVKILEGLGLPKNAWYVTLHMREDGYKGLHSKYADIRNVDPSTYLGAIEEIAKKGGWVFRMGDHHMSHFPEHPNVIDYAHHPINSEFMDIFLGATCKFCLATSSGYYVIPRLFGIPILLTNSSPHPYWSMRKFDLFLPNFLENKKDKTLLDWESYFSSPIAWYGMIENYEKAGLEIIRNTTEEITNATKEIILRIDGEYNYKNKYNRKLEETVMKAGKTAGFDVYPNAPIAQAFFDKYLLNDSRII